MNSDKRKAARYLAPSDEGYVLAHNSSVARKIKDIGRGGLAFNYTPILGESPETAVVDILWNGDTRFHLPNIPCKTVYDISVLAEGQRFSGNENRLRGLEYIKITEAKRIRLEWLLKRKAVKPAP